MSFGLNIVKAQQGLSEIKPEQLEIISTDRPGMADTPYLIKKSNIQIETGFNYEFNDDHNRNNKSFTYNATLVRYGVSNNFELRLTSEYIKTIDRSSNSDIAIQAKGFNALSVGTKIFIVEEQGLLPDISFLASINLPYIGNKELSPTYIAPAFKFMAQHSLTEKLSFSYNGGILWDGNQPMSTGLYTIGLDLTVTPRTTIFIENYGFVPEDGYNQHGFNTGLCFLITRNIQFDISGGFGLTDLSSDGFINFGLSWAPHLKKIKHARN
ncbi:MAG: transporter [Bacteroidota bacterium]|nr:transporter [Bacteroidota bacterium]